jgi:hypothetical protein
VIRGLFKQGKSPKQVVALTRQSLDSLKRVQQRDRYLKTLATIAPERMHAGEAERGQRQVTMEALPPGHPISWGLITSGTVLAGTPYAP